MMNFCKEGQSQKAALSFLRYKKKSVRILDTIDKTPTW